MLTKVHYLVWRQDPRRNKQILVGEDLTLKANLALKWVLILMNLDLIMNKDIYEGASIIRVRLPKRVFKLNQFYLSCWIQIYKRQCGTNLEESRQESMLG